MTGNFVNKVLILIFAFSTAVSADSDGATPDLAGVWKTSYVSLDDPRWTITDLACSGWCSMAAYSYLDGLLKDPANKDVLVKDLLAQAQQYGEEQLAPLLTPLARQKQTEYDVSNDPALDCTPEGDGLRHQVTAPIPIRIDQFEDKIVINYEYWKAVRTVYMDGRGHPENGELTRLGHSIGHYEGSTLVIETTQILPAPVNLPGGYIDLSDESTFIERYTRTGDRLDLVWEIVDPMHLTAPYAGQKASLHAPDWELDEFVCEAITGEF